MRKAKSVLGLIREQRNEALESWVRSKDACPVREGAEGKGPEVVPRRRPTSLQARFGGGPSEKARRKTWDLAGGLPNEANEVAYTIGLIPNPVLEAYAAPLLAEAQTQSQAQAGIKVRLAGEVQHQAGSWPSERRVVFKAEALAEGPNT